MLVKKAMRLSPHYPALYLYSLGYAAYFARQYEEAIAAYKETGKEGADAHIYLGLSYAQLGRGEDAIPRPLPTLSTGHGRPACRSAQRISPGSLPRCACLSARPGGRRRMPPTLDRSAANDAYDD